MAASRRRACEHTANVTASLPRTARIAVIAGDGIGTEVIPAGIDVMHRAAGMDGCTLEFTEFPWGCEYYQRTGTMMSADALDILSDFDAIYLGAVGAPGVPDHVSVWELILPIRQRFDQYVNLRPMRLLQGVPGPLAGRSPADIDMVCIRENSEGEYSGLGGRMHRGTKHEVAEQTGLFTWRGIDRIARYAFELAQRRPRKLLASATKSNALQHSMVLWDEVVESVAADYTDVTCRKYHVDALAARMVTHPQTIDVIVSSNLFGDILTDLGAAISGSLGVAPGANINPERTHPSMFEPIHGSAPDIAGKGIANPIASIWAGALLLDHLGMTAAHDRMVRAIERVVGEGGPRTPDLGGTANTRDVAAAVTDALS
ncbi:MAG TPA: tartrate dehydrogenase [Gemmatimonas aurantiaca]|uniref:D-malate dehydrogenase (decarboxylating) n=1 Tax=Gemmatimonas aurantiaca TaxID=173480 RepID=A0A3D4V5K7_9BACT|nr:tartrate dehydrogenase [Gemmatimonas aurantiaca]